MAKNKLLLPTLGFLFTAITLTLLGGGCSTTARLTDGEVLYTGVKKMKINPTDGERLPDGMVSNLNAAINVPPNGSLPLNLLSPYFWNPWQPGLWIYNHYNDSTRGLGGWIYRNFSKEPVLISDVKPEIRTKMLSQILDDNGYFGSTVSYEELPNEKNPKKAKISYELNVGRPYLLDSIILLNRKGDRLCHFIDSLARKNDYLVKGERFCVDSLEQVRVDIVNRLRNRGYYYMRPEYIEFLADSTITPGKIALKLDLADNMPELATLPYRTGKIVTTILRRSTRHPGMPDTIQTRKGELIVMRPAHLRTSMIPSCITFREGKLFSVRDMDRTQLRLSRMGMFGNITIQPVPVDTSAANPTIDVYITAQFQRPMEASIELNATSKSNSYIGPGLALSVTNNNLFGGGERFTIKLDGSYEWQTGRGRGSVFNSYEVGLNASLAFPRLLAPKFIRRTNRELNWTTLQLGIDLLNRPHYFKMAEFNMGITYDWQGTRNTHHSFTPFKISYTKLMHSTEEFDSIMAVNPAVALSFQSQYIPQLSYTYTLDKFLERARINGINFTATLTEAGNVFDLIYRACGVKGEKRLFGTPFSQFIKGQAQLVYSRRLIRGSDQWLVSRIMIGAEHAYGNSREVPYSEQFYIGGANSIRAFTVRSIGPGSYRAPESDRNGYFDQTGTFKLELNTEYRFPIISLLHGAAFIDAGNVWLLKNDPLRPGGQLKAKTFLRDIALGTGVGLRVDLGMMVIRGDLGYGLHAPYYNGTPHYFNIRFKDAFAFHLAIGYPF